jgi:hypothetical protein
MVAAMFGIRTADSAPPKQIGFVRAVVHVGRAVEHLTDSNSATEELVAGRLDI